MKITLRGTNLCTRYPRDFSELRFMRILIFVLALLTGTASAQEVPLFCAGFQSSGEEIALLEAQDGLFSTAENLGSGSTYGFSLSVYTGGVVYIIRENSKGRIFVRKAALVVDSSEPTALTLPPRGEFIVDDTGNRDQVAVFFSSSPQKRRMLQRALRKASGNFINKVRSTIRNGGISFGFEGCVVALADERLSEYEAVMIVSIDKK